MNIAKHLIPLLLFLTNFFFSGCDNPKLKPPRTDSPAKEEKEATPDKPVDREFARELAREFAREFAIEFARQMKIKGKNSVKMNI